MKKVLPVAHLDVSCPNAYIDYDQHLFMHVDMNKIVQGRHMNNFIQIEKWGKESFEMLFLTHEKRDNIQWPQKIKYTFYMDTQLL